MDVGGSRPGNPDRTVSKGVLHPPIPSTIGPYKILEQIGEGGMGEVYLAEQTEPIRRTVAIKLIKRGMDSERVIARFEELELHGHQVRVGGAGDAFL